MTTTVKFVRLPHAVGLPLPRYQTTLAAGLDLVAAIPAEKPIELVAGARAAIPTGLMIALPAGKEGQIRPRSGLAIRDGITVLNAPGTIDADYRGELQVILINHGTKPFVVTRGMRIAQFVIASIEQAELTETTSLDETERADGGFGSTGRA